MGNPLPRRIAENPPSTTLMQSPSWSMTPLLGGVRVHAHVLAEFLQIAAKFVF